MNEDQASFVIDYLGDISRDVKKLVEMLKPFLEEPPPPVRISADRDAERFRDSLDQFPREMKGGWVHGTPSAPPPDQL